MAPISLRFKRKDMTVFLVVEQTDTFRKIASRLSTILNNKPEDIQLYQPGKEKPYGDESMISDHSLQDDAIVYICINGELPPGIEARI